MLRNEDVKVEQRSPWVAYSCSQVRCGKSHAFIGNPDRVPFGSGQVGVRNKHPRVCMGLLGVRWAENPACPGVCGAEGKGIISTAWLS